MPLDTYDYRNMKALLSRCTFQGVDEAQIGVILAHKLEQAIQEATAPKVDEHKDITDGDNADFTEPSS